MSAGSAPLLTVGSGPDAGAAAGAGAGAGAEADVSQRRPGWRRALPLVVAGVVGVVLLAVVVAMTARRASFDDLDPDSPERSGTRALVQVLRQQGVEVVVVRSIEELQAESVDDRTTVVVGSSQYLGAGAAALAIGHAAEAHRLVLLQPTRTAVEAMALPVEEVGSTAGRLGGRCALRVARPGDTLETPTSLYAALDGAEHISCFADSEAEPPGAAVVLLSRSGSSSEVLVVGAAAAFTNAEVGARGHAGLAVRSLGASPTLVWYHPSVSDLTVAGPGGTGAEDDGVPEWFGPAAIVALLGMVLLALVRGRRLGRLAVEPLPVVVRAVETTEARGHMYRRARDQRRAAEALRAGTTSRLERRLGLSRRTPVASLAVIVAEASGRPHGHVAAVLHGPPPTTDRDLLLLAQQLTDLEESVRTA